MLVICYNLYSILILYFCLLEQDNKNEMIQSLEDFVFR